MVVAGVCSIVCIFLTKERLVLNSMTKDQRRTGCKLADGHFFKRFVRKERFMLSAER